MDTALRAAYQSYSEGGIPIGSALVEIEGQEIKLLGGARGERRKPCPHTQRRWRQSSCPLDRSQVRHAPIVPPLKRGASVRGSGQPCLSLCQGPAGTAAGRHRGPIDQAQWAHHTITLLHFRLWALGGIVMVPALLCTMSGVRNRLQAAVDCLPHRSLRCPSGTSAVKVQHIDYRAL